MSNSNENQRLDKTNINWDNGIYGNSAEIIENTHFLIKRLLHI